MLNNKKICVIGCGNMGEALISGMLRAKLFPADNITGVDTRKERLEYLREKEKIRIEKAPKKAVKRSDIILLSVKPKDMRKALEDIKGSITGEMLVISIAAGITTKFIEGIIAEKVPVIRVMPNTPALLCLGASGICRGKRAGELDEETASEILGSVGEVIKVTEDKMDAITALSGSGPAYVFYFIEALIEAGVKAGLDKGEARKLVLQTIMGSVYMMFETDDSPETLRKKVTSPGGTTEAALKVITEEKFKDIIIRAVKRAKERSLELGKKDK